MINFLYLETDEADEPILSSVSTQDRNLTLFDFCPTAAETEESVVPESSFIRLRHHSTRRWVRATNDPIDVNEATPVMSKVKRFIPLEIYFQLLYLFQRIFHLFRLAYMFSK